MKKCINLIRIMVALSLGAGASLAYADAKDVEANLSRLKVPAGFKVEVYAEVPGARQMALGTAGTVYVGTRGNKVYAVVDKNKDHKADQVVTLMDDLSVGNGVAMHNGNLYVAEQNRIARYAAPDFDLNLPFKQMREVIYDKLPNKAHHGWRYISFGPDNKLYVTVGAPCNICDPQGVEASILRMDPDGGHVETFAKGVRNSVGMDFQPGTGVLHFTDNGMDMMGDDIPHDELNAAPKAGLHFGFPYFGGRDARPKEWQNKKPPQDVTPPVVEFQAHSANLGFKFYTGKQFPAEYQGNAIVAQHGSWNRSQPVGYQLMRVVFDEHHQPKSTEVFIDGWLNDGEAWGRPTDVLQLNDGSLLVSDDYSGVIYRISYGEKNAPVSSAGKKITGLKMPESAIAHSDGRIFVTEIGEFGKNGDGKITVINQDGSTKTLADGLNDPKGIDLFNDQLYIADVDHVVRVGLDGSKTIIAKPADFQQKPIFLNDIEIDGLGNVYVSDSGDDNGKHAAIYKIAPNGKVTQIINDQSGIKRPNGLLMDGPNKLLVADFGNGKLFQVVFNEPSAKAKATVTLLNSGFGGADGLVRDTDGLLYVSDWAGGNVWQLSEPKATPQLISKGHQSAADITLSSDGKTLLIPDMKGGELVYLPIK
ncbi:SMP-30/gluconolactonase/LRE family protein [Methylobacillus gramineus]|uniref:SMP-30/gluconolactonase/LRE family protein n=1 Tax=Methylobacillus gramineus TaxID=755169 RepID=UPI001CFFCA02|nr:SMP-30/gluconolactonase/LRE family protein [Methylobacillus gramineus]MCB5185133.1 SMP-30/gluconolactonase/LRE family protein [Methylobacillus gramineus]